MLAFGNKEFRNLQEQVLENMRQIDDIKQAAVVLDEFGIKVIGQLESADELPDPETYEGDFGDAYAVGTEAPYELYIWTRGDSLGNNAYWFDIGAFPQAGPQGEQGPRGEQGPSGTIAFGSMSVTTTEPGTNANVSFTNIGTASNAVYNLSWYIPRGAQGIPGETGATGATGATGPQGPKGDKGDTGTGYIIMGQLDSELDLPDPGSTDRQAAYLVGTHEPYELYVIVGTIGHLEWFDAGLFTTAQVDINEFEAGYGLSLGQIDSKIAYAVDTNVIPVFQDLSDLAWNINASVANTYATKASLSSFQSDVNSAFSSVYGAIDALSSVYATPSDVSTALSSAEMYADGVGLTQKAYTDTSIEALSSIYATPAQVSSAISQLDYASVGALSSATVIPDITGLASVSYVDNSIAALSSVYASISAIPDMSEYATVSQVSSAISALDYASVGALSAGTVIPDITGYATESYVASAIGALDYLSVGAMSIGTAIPNITASYAGNYWTEMTLDGVTKEFGAGGGATYTAGSNISINSNNVISLSTQVALGTGAQAYFQSPRFRGEGDETTYYHAIDYGYPNHDLVDNYEYGKTWNFWDGSDGYSKSYQVNSSSLCLGIRSDCLLNKTNTFLWPSTGGTLATEEWVSQHGGGGGGTAGVTEIGGATGSISLGTGLSMNGSTLYATGSAVGTTAFEKVYGGDPIASAGGQLWADLSNPDKILVRGTGPGEEYDLYTFAGSTTDNSLVYYRFPTNYNQPLFEYYIIPSNGNPYTENFYAMRRDWGYSTTNEYAIPEVSTDKGNKQYLTCSIDQYNQKTWSWEPNPKIINLSQYVDLNTGMTYLTIGQEYADDIQGMYDNPENYIIAFSMSGSTATRYAQFNTIYSDTAGSRMWCFYSIASDQNYAVRFFKDSNMASTSIMVRAYSYPQYGTGVETWTFTTTGGTVTKSIVLG